MVQRCYTPYFAPHAQDLQLPFMVSSVNQIAGRAVASPHNTCQAKAAARISRLSRVLVKSQSVQQQERTEAAEFVSSAPKSKPAASPRSVEERQQSSARINVIAKSRWASGIPPVMGAHLMSSGTVMMRCSDVPCTLHGYLNLICLCRRSSSDIYQQRCRSGRHPPLFPLC